MLIHDLPTPALLLDLDILDRNLLRMQKKISDFGTSLRPHIKTHKCIQIGRKQEELGAKGITVSTFYEAEQFALNGFTDITWAFPIPPAYAAKAVELAKKVTFRVVVDSDEAIKHLVQACKSLDGHVHVWLKVDCGYHRAGVDPQSPLAEELVRTLSESKALTFDGILSHSGHAYAGKSRSEILSVANQERDVMKTFADAMHRKGYRIPAISIGSTPAMSVIKNLDGIGEVRPGNYCFYDQTMVSLGVCEVEDCAVSVLASVISHQPGASHFVIDAGALALSKDTGVAASPSDVHMGSLFENYTSAQLDRRVRLKTLSQEHGKVLAEHPGVIEGKFHVGDKVRILENHSCLTVAHFDEYCVVRGEEVVDRWKILRGRI